MIYIFTLSETWKFISVYFNCLFILTVNLLWKYFKETSWTLHNILLSVFPLLSVLHSCYLTPVLHKFCKEFSWRKSGLTWWSLTFQIWRLVCGRAICLDLKDTFCSSLLIYNFRIFERRYGSRKFSVSSSFEGLFSRNFSIQFSLVLLDEYCSFISSVV